MTASRHRLVPVLLSAGLLIGAANLGAYAATGGPLLLGKKNTADGTTTIATTGKGPAVKLRSKPGKAAFAVSNKAKIKKLNADRVDGQDGKALQTKVYRYNLSGTANGTYIRFALPQLPRGRYLASYAVSAQMPGVADFFGCLLDSGTAFANGQIAGLGASAGGNGWYVTGSGLLDTTSRTYTLTCQTSVGGAGFTVPSSVSPAQVAFTRVDDVTSRPGTLTPVGPVMKSGLGG